MNQGQPPNRKNCTAWLEHSPSPQPCKLLKRRLTLLSGWTVFLAAGVFLASAFGNFELNLQNAPGGLPEKASSQKLTTAKDTTALVRLMTHDRLLMPTSSVYSLAGSVSVNDMPASEISAQFQNGSDSSYQTYPSNQGTVQGGVTMQGTPYEQNTAAYYGYNTAREAFSPAYPANPNGNNYAIQGSINNARRSQMASFAKQNAWRAVKLAGIIISNSPYVRSAGTFSTGLAVLGRGMSLYGQSIGNNARYRQLAELGYIGGYGNSIYGGGYGQSSYGSRQSYGGNQYGYGQQRSNLAMGSGMQMQGPGMPMGSGLPMQGSGMPIQRQFSDRGSMVASADRGMMQAAQSYIPEGMAMSAPQYDALVAQGDASYDMGPQYPQQYQQQPQYPPQQMQQSYGMPMQGPGMPMQQMQGQYPQQQQQRMSAYGGQNGGGQRSVYQGYVAQTGMQQGMNRQSMSMNGAMSQNGMGNRRRMQFQQSGMQMGSSMPMQGSGMPMQQSGMQNVGMQGRMSMGSGMPMQGMQNAGYSGQMQQRGGAMQMYARAQNAGMQNAAYRPQSSGMQSQQSGMQQGYGMQMQRPMSQGGYPQQMGQRGGVSGTQAMARPMMSNNRRNDQPVAMNATAMTGGSSAGVSEAVRHYNLGAYYGQRNSIPQAIQEFKSAVATNPNFADAYVGLSMAYLYQHDWPNVISNGQRAIQLKDQLMEPGNLMQANFNVATAYCASDSATNAQPYLTQVQSLDAASGQKLQTFMSRTCRPR